MSWLKLLDPRKKKWWKKEEWVQAVHDENVYKVAEEHDCPSWDLHFYFADKYKHKDTCETRWRLNERVTILDKTIFEPPEEHIKDTNYKLYSDLNFYEGPDYEQ